eukprot:CAMPEP_0174250658 /NCGR_PEP_ID=MMETSP0439-20130205/765_1 /TAXON_ID=0 /ORGANISM="Stereomyxa ramosa, Strain Chinc5" /LENGTH=467 /DNA_ID=CAMNT_0015330789 /DNA_START=121 /DNA_END=1521 /DNA_ORIENTATION=+
MASSTGWKQTLHEAVWTNNHSLLKIILFDTLSPLGLEDTNNKSQKEVLEEPKVPHLFKEDVNKEEHGYTALFLACLKGYSECAQILLEAGANPNLGGKNGSAPIFSAAIKGMKELVETFVSYSECDLTVEHPEQKCGAIHAAADKGFVDCVEILLKAGVDVDSRSTLQHMTPLHYAASSGHSQVVKLLLQYKADPDATSSIGYTPIILAANKGQEEAVEALLKVADINIGCKFDGFTCLHSAACFGYEDLAKKMIEAGADVNSNFDPFHNTPLHVAAAKSQYNLVSLLLANGANINERNKPGSTALRLAAANEHELEDKRSFMFTAKVLLANGANINTQNLQGNTPLHALVVRSGDLNNLRFLISNGADPYIKNLEGNSCMDFIQNEAVREILESYEVIDVVKTKWTPDKDVMNCQYCNLLFTLIRRRHHCRGCGKIFCSECAFKRMAVSGYTGPQRVCNPCFEMRG